MNSIHQLSYGPNVKNLLFTTRGNQTYLWITFTYETAKIQYGFYYMLKSILSTVRLHSMEFWSYNNHEAL